MIMEHIVYLIALRCPNYLKTIRKHAKRVSKQLKKANVDSYDFAALATAKWKQDYGSILCIGDNRKDTLVFYPIKDFEKHLNGFTYLPIESEQFASVFTEFETFLSHEMREGGNNANEIYKVIIVDFRKNSSVFVGNEADEIVQSLEYNFGNRSDIFIICQKDNQAAYGRLEELLSDDGRKKLYVLGSHGRENPFSSSAIAEMMK